MNYVNAALLGALQGLTEFLPISSTAHLLVGERLLGFSDPGGAFTVMIQLGSIVAIAWLYRARILQVLRGLPRDPGARRFALALAIGVVPVLVAGGLGRAFVTGVLYERASVLAVALILGGLVMLAVERLRLHVSVRLAEQTGPSTALAIGISQALAIIPGVSRSGATIVGGMLAGLDRTTAAEFSFFLAIPTMTAAFLNDLRLLGGGLVTVQPAEVAVGFGAAFLASAAVVGPFLRLVRRVGFLPFAWYRILAGALLLAAVWSGWDLH